MSNVTIFNKFSAVNLTIWETMMLVGKGDLVRHPIRPSWGIGRVVKTVSGGNLIVRFEEVGNKLLNPGFAGLVKVRDDELLFLVIREVQVKKGRPIRTFRVIPVVKRQA